MYILASTQIDRADMLTSYTKVWSISNAWEREERLSGITNCLFLKDKGLEPIQLKRRWQYILFPGQSSEV